MVQCKLQLIVKPLRSLVRPALGGVSPLVCQRRILMVVRGDRNYDGNIHSAAAQDRTMLQLTRKSSHHTGPPADWLKLIK